MFDNGCEWIRCDFNLHTRKDKEFKYTGEDNSFISGYVNKLESEKIKIGVITNHNKFDLQEYKALKKAANKKDLFILPGVELSVKDGKNGVHTLIVFTPEDWIKNGRQGAFEVNNFTSPAFVARVNYHGVKGLRVGASFYYNQTAKNGTKPWRNTGYKFPVTIVTGDLQYKGFNNNLIVRGNAVYGNLGASGALTTINNSSSAASGYPNTTVAQNAVSYGGEAGYNIGSFFHSKAPRIYPFIRYEYYNPMEKTEANTGLLADKRFQVSAVTAGLNYYALPNLVIKADYTHRSIGGGKYNDENLVSVGIAYIGWFIKK